LEDRQASTGAGPTFRALIGQWRVRPVLTDVVSLSPRIVDDVRVLFEYGGSALQGGLKFRERQDVEEVFRLRLTEIVRNPVREHTTPIERGLRPGFLDGA
jgi:hypothetical protein